MKKVINLKETIMILISVLLITVTTSVLATDGGGLFVDGNNSSTTISQNEYDNAQTPTVDNNSTLGGIQTGNTTNDTTNNTTNNTINNTTNNTVKTYNTNSNDDDEKIPQTGVEDYNIGILLIICVASAIFAYKKVNDYKNI